MKLRIATVAALGVLLVAASPVLADESGQPSDVVNCMALGCPGSPPATGEPDCGESRCSVVDRNVDPIVDPPIDPPAPIDPPEIKPVPGCDYGAGDCEIKFDPETDKCVIERGTGATVWIGRATKYYVINWNWGADEELDAALRERGAQFRQMIIDRDIAGLTAACAGSTDNGGSSDGSGTDTSSDGSDQGGSTDGSDQGGSTGGEDQTGGSDGGPDYPGPFVCDANEDGSRDCRSTEPLPWVVTDSGEQVCAVYDASGGEVKRTTLGKSPKVHPRNNRSKSKHPRKRSTRSRGRVKPKSAVRGKSKSSAKRRPGSRTTAKPNFKAKKAKKGRKVASKHQAK